jgi:hypothetical protein
MKNAAFIAGILDSIVTPELGDVLSLGRYTGLSHAERGNSRTTMEYIMETTLQSLLSVPPRNFGSSSSPSSRTLHERAASAERSEICQVIPLEGIGKPDPGGAMFSYRHDWGELSGSWRLFLVWDAADARSHVFVSIAESAAGGPDVGKLVGEVKSSLCDVAPTDGGIGMRVHIDGNTPIRLYADYLVINGSGIG